MTDAEWEALQPLVSPQETRRGRPAADRRRSWDAVFHVALSRDPWRALPPHLGKPGTAHRTLLRAHRAGLMQNMLFYLSSKARSHRPELRSLALRLLRAIRRIAGCMTLQAILLAKRLGLCPALPVHPLNLPRPDLLPALAEAARRLFAAPRWTRADRTLFESLHNLAAGDLRAWSTR
jgi:transposase